MTSTTARPAPIVSRNVADEECEEEDTLLEHQHKNRCMHVNEFPNRRQSEVKDASNSQSYKTSMSSVNFLMPPENKSNRSRTRLARGSDHSRNGKSKHLDLVLFPKGSKASNSEPGLTPKAKMLPGFVVKLPYFEAPGVGESSNRKHQDGLVVFSRRLKESMKNAGDVVVSNPRPRRQSTKKTKGNSILARLKHGKPSRNRCDDGNRRDESSGDEQTSSNKHWGSLNEFQKKRGCCTDLTASPERTVLAMLIRNREHMQPENNYRVIENPGDDSVRHDLQLPKFCVDDGV